MTPRKPKQKSSEFLPSLMSDQVQLPQFDQPRERRPHVSVCILEVGVVAEEVELYVLEVGALLSDQLNVLREQPLLHLRRSPQEAAPGQQATEVVDEIHNVPVGPAAVGSALELQWNRRWFLKGIEEV